MIYITSKVIYLAYTHIERLRSRINVPVNGKRRRADVITRKCRRVIVRSYEIPSQLRTNILDLSQLIVEICSCSCDLRLVTTKWGLLLRPKPAPTVEAFTTVEACHHSCNQPIFSIQWDAGNAICMNASPLVPQILSVAEALLHRVSTQTVLWYMQNI